MVKRLRLLAVVVAVGSPMIQVPPVQLDRIPVVALLALTASLVAAAHRQVVATEESDLVLALVVSAGLLGFLAEMPQQLPTLLRQVAVAVVAVMALVADQAQMAMRQDTLMLVIDMRAMEGRVVHQERP